MELHADKRACFVGSVLSFAKKDMIVKVRLDDLMCAHSVLNCLQSPAAASTLDKCVPMHDACISIQTERRSQVLLWLQNESLKEVVNTFPDLAKLVEADKKVQALAQLLCNRRGSASGWVCCLCGKLSLVQVVSVCRQAQ